MAGKFISIEGSEGVGKSTQMAFIAAYFANAGHDVVKTREPGGTPLAERIRSLLLAHDDEKMCMDTELLLMFAARAQHIDQVIKPGLEKGFVVTDRFTDASYAYQGGGRGVPMARIEVLEEWVQQGLKPDCVIILDAPITVGRERAGKRSAPDRIEKEDLSFFESVRTTYLDRAKQFPGRYHVVDATQSIEAVKAQITPILAALNG
ncbi:MAG: dTMP kinase [Methylococcales bacterium]|jgi:dTMP kinase|nr:dTMP kinase [Methylococcales bacterium]MBT7443626.1 dTMP kinase [Methylococcales bacterium]